MKKTTVKTPAPKAHYLLERANVDDLPLCLSVVEEIEQISASLDGLVEILGQDPEHRELEKFAELLRPTQRWLANIISSDFPDTVWCRKWLEDNGFGSQIRG
jgi:hypothetical protein